MFRGRKRFPLFPRREYSILELSGKGTVSVCRTETNGNTEGEKHRRRKETVWIIFSCKYLPMKFWE